jgi:predicted nucleotidyltransferase component of viral defense system
MTKDTELFRQATQEESDFSYYKLYPLQDKILDMMNSPAFYLTGGTALSRVHYQHRFSDDLSFFYDGYSFPRENFIFFYREILSNLDKVFDNLEVTIDGDYIKRLFIDKGGVSLKVEFVYENFQTVGEKTKFRNVWIDSKENICTNKIGTMLDRRVVKDFIDLYFLLQEVELKQTILWSELKKLPPDYERLIIGAEDLLKNPDLLEGNVLTILPVDIDDFRNFVKKIIKGLLHDAKEL